MSELSPAELLAPEMDKIWATASTLNEPTPAEIARIRSVNPDLSAELVSAVITQIQLRRKAQSTLGPTANTMLFTRAGLQQRGSAMAAMHLREQGGDDTTPEPKTVG